MQKKLLLYYYHFRNSYILAKFSHKNLLENEGMKYVSTKTQGDGKLMETSLVKNKTIFITAV